MSQVGRMIDQVQVAQAPERAAVIPGASIVRRYLVFQRPDDDRKVFAYLLPIALPLVFGEVYEGCLDLPLPPCN